MKAIGWVFILPLVGLVAFYDATVLLRLWGWFAIPIFHLPAITKYQAYGLMALVSVAIYRPEVGERSATYKGLKGSYYLLTGNVLANTLALFCGYLCFRLG